MFRILTENKNADAVKKLLASLDLDYTIYYCEGSWKRQSEKSMLIELGTASGVLAERVAELIKKTNVQEAVLLQEIPATNRLV